MSQEFESDSEEIGCTRSGKRYKVDFRSSFFEDSSDSTRKQSQSNRERTVGGIPYHPYTPQELHLVVHTQYILPLHHLHLHRQVVVTQQIRIHLVETEWRIT